MHRLPKEDNPLSLFENASRIQGQDNEQDKLLLLEILKKFARLYLLAATNYFVLKDREKQRFSLHNWYFIIGTITHIEGESLQCNITQEDEYTKFQFDKLKILLQEQPLLIRWASSEMAATIFDFKDANKLLETILQDQIILANTQS